MRRPPRRRRCRGAWRPGSARSRCRTAGLAAVPAPAVVQQLQRGSRGGTRRVRAQRRRCIGTPRRRTNRQAANPEKMWNPFQTRDFDFILTPPAVASTSAPASAAEAAHLHATPRPNFAHTSHRGRPCSAQPAQPAWDRGRGALSRQGLRRPASRSLQAAAGSGSRGPAPRCSPWPGTPWSGTARGEVRMHRAPAMYMRKLASVSYWCTSRANTDRASVRSAWHAVSQGGCI